MSSFATDSVESNGLVSFLEYAQLNSVMALYEGACYAPNMSAFNSTAFRLLGPLLVLLFAVALTWIIQKLQPRLQQRNMDMSVSYSGTLAVTVLFVFSNVSMDCLWGKFQALLLCMPSVVHLTKIPKKESFTFCSYLFGRSRRAP
jgi:dipeptide/tripeptide permease